MAACMMVTRIVLRLRGSLAITLSFETSLDTAHRVQTAKTRILYWPACDQRCQHTDSAGYGDRGSSFSANASAWLSPFNVTVVSSRLLMVDPLSYPCPQTTSAIGTGVLKRHSKPYPTLQ